MTQRELTHAPAANRAPRWFDRVNALLVSSFGLGYAPVASGTFGTLGGVALVLLLDRFICPRFEISFRWAAFVAAALVLVLGISLGGWAERFYRLKDPGPFVLDEVVGYVIAVFRWKEGGPGVKEMVLAFLAFRVFDVVKPWPARRLEFLFLIGELPNDFVFIFAGTRTIHEFTQRNTRNSSSCGFVDRFLPPWSRAP